MNFKIGDYIKVHPKYYDTSWYHNNMMQIMNIHNLKDYEVDYIFSSSKEKFIFHEYVFQDDECKNKNREEKLKRILK